MLVILLLMRILHKLAPVIKMEMKSDSDDSDDDEKYHIRCVGSGQISHLVNNGSYDAGMDADINSLVNKYVRDDEPDGKIPKLDKSAYSNMDNNSDEESSGLIEDRNSMYVDDLKQSDNHVPFPIPPTENKKYSQRKCVLRKRWCST